MGCPDISLLEPLAEALGLSVDQLLTYQTAPAETERAEEPAPTSEAVQAVLDLTLAERRARRRRRWFIAMAAALRSGAVEAGQPEPCFTLKKFARDGVTIAIVIKEEELKYE